MDFAVLKDYGIDCEKGIARCLHDEKLYERILMLFLADDSLPRAEAALQSRNYRELYNCAHELKGSSANAEMSELYEAASILVEFLRDVGDDVIESDIGYLYGRMKESYIKTREGIMIASGM